MGVIRQGILGGVSGKVGGVVGANWKGVDYLKGYTIPANPQTTPQTEQRSLFASIVAFAKLILGTVIADYWNPFASGKSGYNAFCQANLNLCSYPFSYADVRVAQGSLESCAVATSVYTSATGALVTTWDWPGLGNGLATDIAAILCVDTANNVTFISDSVQRSVETATFNVGSGRSAANLKVYLFFHRGTGAALEVSNSDYYQVTAP